jgi:hypothetical protein
MSESNKKAIFILIIMALVISIIVMVKDFIFDISKQTQQFTPPALIENSLFKYSELSGPVEVVPSVDSTSIEGVLLLPNNEYHGFIIYREELSHHCNGFLIFEYDNERNTVIASATPMSAKKHTPAQLVNCFEKVMTEISKERERHVSISSGESWNKSKLDLFLDFL